MKIGIDAISAIGRSGNGTYTRELGKGLEKIDKENNYYLFSFLHDWGRATPLTFLGRSHWHEVHCYISRTLVPFDRVGLINDQLVKLAAWLRGVDIFHFTNPLNFTPGSYKSVVTVHDLSPLYDSGWSKAQLQSSFVKKMQTIAQKADVIIAVSEFTKKDIIEKLHVPASKITVVYEAASSFYTPDTDLALVKEKFSTSKYLLYAGQLQPRKNILNLVRAWGSIAELHPEYKLILAGGARDEEYLHKIQEAIRESHSQNSVVVANSVSDVLLRKLYSGARCLVYPSFFEGFGLPVLEAMQCGTPVIASNTSSLPELVGEAGLLVNPYNIEDIAQAIEKMLNDEGLWREMQARAKAQAAKFSWERAAKETLEVYKKVSIE